MTSAAQRSCHGVFPLTARTEGWQRDLCARPSAVRDLIAEHGSPVNVLHTGPLEANAGELADAAVRVGVELGIYFARKANKALSLVDEALRLGLGVDVASERELLQVLERGAAPASVIVTAAVKPKALLELSARHGAVVAIDNLDELRTILASTRAMGRRSPVALRIAPDIPGRPPSRFGFTVPDAIAAVGDMDPEGDLDVRGIHFHVDGYDADDRVLGVAQSLELVQALRAGGHQPKFVDIGGGIPMRYIDDPRQWSSFWEAHRAGLMGDGEPLTFQGHGLGLTRVGDVIVGTPNVYPSAQPVVRGEWLSGLLAARLAAGQTVAAGIRDGGLRLHCEPGRSLVDGCGMTLARVEFRKPTRDGSWLIGVAMNRTQCRSTSDDFMVDPVLVPCADADGPRCRADDGPIDGYLVGAYCIERELLTWRRMSFPHGVRVGDVIAFPNTAGYLMHILESASHQMPLARNVVVDGAGAGVVDLIDEPGGSVDETSEREGVSRHSG